MSDTPHGSSSGLGKTSSTAFGTCPRCWGPVAPSQPLCPGCDALVPPHPRISHFDYLDLSPAPRVNPAALEDAYLKRIKLCHPDTFCDDAPRWIATQWTSGINQAYTHLKNPVQALLYWLTSTYPDLETPAVPKETLSKLLACEAKLSDETPRPADTQMGTRVTDNYITCLQQAYATLDQLAIAQDNPSTTDHLPALRSVYLNALEASFWQKLAARHALDLPRI